MQHIAFTFADPDHYAPVETSAPGTAIRPTHEPAGWARRDNGFWTVWTPAGVVTPAQGWKVHVSSPLEDVQRVLDVVTNVCTELAVPFKHIRGRRFFLWMHHKHGSRVQSGKFCALYPPTPELAHQVLTRLEAELAGQPGPYVLTDRRFGSSTCVSYRYGAFRARYRLRPDGTRQPTMLASDGTEIADERRPEFLLPAGIADPFAPPTPDEDDGPVTFHGYTFEGVVQHSNAGGAYRARTADGSPVFVKEARAHNGYTWEGRDARTRVVQEYETLRAVHAARPGLCPEPVELFEHWENTYLVTELVPGRALTKWIVAHNPAIEVGRSPGEFADYYERCLRILDRVTAAVDALHDAGYAFVDLNPGNVLVDDEENVRLVDFEAAVPRSGPAVPLGAPGFLPPEVRDPRALARLDPCRIDEYALSALAQMMVFPLHGVVERSPQALDHLFAGLSARGPVPPRLWRVATRYAATPDRPALPAPAAVSSDPAAHLRQLLERATDSLVASARPDHPAAVFPTIPQGFESNTRCVAYGTAGVLHVLRTAGRDVDRPLVDRLRDESLRERAATPPGLLFGNAGIAWVLADLGEEEVADALLDAAVGHPLATADATLGGGAAGVAMAALARYVRTGEQSRLEQACRLLDDIPDGGALTARLGANDASGLPHGRPGVALALYYAGRLTGDRRFLDRGVRLLHDELGHALPLPVDALGFRVSTRDGRNMPYLYAGSAGYAHVATRYLTVVDDAQLRDAFEKCLRACTVRFTVNSGLFQGLAGLGLVLGEAARLLGRPELAVHEREAGRALFTYAVPHQGGVLFTGDKGSRLSSELWSGTAGVVLSLHHMVNGCTDPLFTLDAAVSTTTPTDHHAGAILAGIG